MLSITIPGEEVFNDETQEFIKYDDVTMDLEHSLVSLSKWESVWEKPFLSSASKSEEETRSYIEMMAIGDFPPEVFQRLNESNLNAVNDYLNRKMTATWFNEAARGGKRSSETITSEIIYYWMISLNIPSSFETWHLNRLFTLIKVFNEKNAPKKKMSASEIAARNRRLNAERKQRLNTEG